MRKSDAFPSQFMRASDLNGPILLTMGKTENRDLGNDIRPVLSFQATDKKPLVLNQINWNTIEREYGQDSDEWVGKQIVVYPSTTDYKGETVACTRVRAPKKPEGKRKPAVQEEMDDDIPF